MAVSAKEAAKASGKATPPSLAWAVVGVLGLALAVRVYYLVVTRGQPVWWDEAEYLLAARHVAEGTPLTGFFEGRPMLLSWVLSASFAVGLDELGVRIFLVVVSFAAVWLVYSIGRRLYGQLTGLVAALLLSTIYVHVFYTTRVMTEIPHVTACLFGVDLLLSERPRRVLFAVPLLVVGALTRFPAALMFLVVGAWALLVARARLARSRAFLQSLVIAALFAAPYLVWATVTYGDPLHSYKVSRFHIPDLGFKDGIDGLRFYFAQSYGTLGPVLMALLGVGVLRAMRWVLHPRRVLVEGDRELAAGLLLSLWMATPVLYFSFLLRPLDDRFCILAVPPALMAIGDGVVWLSGLVLGQRPPWHAGVALGVGLAAALFMLRLTDAQVMNRRTSYGELRDAGLALKGSTEPAAVVMTQSKAQITYYSERPTVGIPRDPVAFLRQIAEKKPELMLISRLEEHPAWLTQQMLRGLGFRPVAKYPPGAERSVVVVLKVPAKLKGG